jgi:hypothetical protein
MCHQSITTHGFPQLVDDPSAGGMSGDIAMQDAATVVSDFVQRLRNAQVS